MVFFFAFGANLELPEVVTMKTIKLTLLFSLLTVLMVLIGGSLGGETGMVAAFFFAATLNFLSYWFSDKIVLKMYRAQEIGPLERPVFFHTVQRLALQAGLPMPKVYVIPSESPNAFATGRNPSHAAVAATEGILQLLSDRELEGVLAHELGHVQNRDILIGSIAATFAGAISMLGNMLQLGALFGSGRNHDGGNSAGALGTLAIAIVAPIAALMVQLAIARSREYQADATGARLCGRPLALADALRKLHTASQVIPMQEARPASAHMFIVNPLTGGAFSSLFSTHPPMGERIARLEAMARGK
jgi:heat shock protein HtpX